MSGKWNWSRAKRFKTYEPVNGGEDVALIRVADRRRWKVRRPKTKAELREMLRQAVENSRL